MAVRRDDVEAALQARHELGKGYEDEIVDSLVEKIEARLERRPERRPQRNEPQMVRHGSVTPMALGSIGMGIPITAIAAGNGDPWLAAIAWVAIALVNLGYAFRR
jgi:hypothetical protein